jgi:hypothetical protein
LKLALITDLHYGIRNDSVILLDNNKRFLDNVFFPRLRQEDIHTVVCLGDLLDRRKYINYLVAHRLRTDFMEAMWRNDVHQFHWILGNHDIFWRQRTDVNAADELYPTCVYDAPFFHVYDEATEVHFDNTKVLFVPWICDQNREQCYELINKTDARICFGHLEITGFEMYKGIVSRDGEDRERYQNFDTVCTGHYHHRSSDGRIFYLGASGEFIWSDHNDDRGFHIYDCDSRELTFIKNPHTLFAKVFYDDANGQYNGIDAAQLNGKFVKVVVKSRTNSDAYNTFMAQVESAQPAELQVVEDHLNLNLVTDSNIVSDAKSTLDIMREYIQSTNNLVNATKLDSLIVDLYHRALSAE